MRNVSSVERWIPETRRWSPCHPLPSAMLGARYTALRGDEVMTTGGCAETTSSESWSWSAERDSWLPTSPLCTDRYGHGGCLLEDGSALVVGGLRQSSANQPLVALRSAEVWLPNAGCWREVAPLPLANAEPTVTALPTGDALVTGGYDDDFFRACFVYRRSRQRWSETGSLAVARAGHTATLLSDGRVLVVGGVSDFDTDNDGAAIGEAEIWDPGSGQYTTIAGPQSPRLGHSATLLPDGRVLIAGGRHKGVALATAELWSPR